MSLKDKWKLLEGKFHQNTEAEGEEKKSTEEPAKASVAAETASDTDVFENLKNRQYSRSARNHKEKAISPTIKVLIFMGVLFIVLPYLLYVVYTNNKKQPESLNVDQVMVSKQKNEGQEKADEESQKEKESQDAQESKKKADDQAKEASKKAAEDAKKDLDKEDGNTSRQKPRNNQAAASYKVTAGDNLYRIAVRHGMTLNQLLELNGLQPNSKIVPGSTLRVYK
ncbi:LysM peptidoglycan-binding domain-containing protein [Aerococcus christensenii]|uniref:LysM peptidoglycan-binding domain-containing protein n=1 Tax=Aerococcus christensenii TaxID=87541 RepID=UPI0007632BBA|nr:LysM domain-containing protein [Aerococcus christensenii]AMB92056.1 hypothetical protein AWM71_01390 [Aerococcus christensenii]